MKFDIYKIMAVCTLV